MADATIPQSATFDNARMGPYGLSDAELAKLHQLAGPFFTRLKRTFGARAPYVTVYVLGVDLAHTLADTEAESEDDEALYAGAAVAAHLWAAHKLRGGTRWHLAPSNASDDTLSAAVAARVN
jgi:hypothetical protein